MLLLLLLPVLVLLLLGELLHELDEVLAGDNLCASFVLFSCALSFSAMAVGGVDAVGGAVADAKATGAAAAAAGSTIITLLMGIDVVVVAVLLLWLLASASTAALAASAALRADLSIGVGGK